MDAMPAVPTSTKTSLEQKVTALAKERWPQLATVQVRHRARFAYLDAVYPDGTIQPLCRLRYNGSAHQWGFDLPRQPRRLPRQHPAQRLPRRHPTRSPRLRLRPLPR